jgi:hypothetical protein
VLAELMTNVMTNVLAEVMTKRGRSMVRDGCLTGGDGLAGITKGLRRLRI